MDDVAFLPPKSYYSQNPICCVFYRPLAAQYNSKQTCFELFMLCVVTINPAKEKLSGELNRLFFLCQVLQISKINESLKHMLHVANICYAGKIESFLKYELSDFYVSLILKNALLDLISVFLSERH